MSPLETITKRLAEIEARASRVKPDKLEVERVAFNSGKFTYNVCDAYDATAPYDPDDHGNLVRFSEADFQSPMQAKFHAELYAHSRADIPALVSALKVAVEHISRTTHNCLGRNYPTDCFPCSGAFEIAAALGGEADK